MAHETAEILIGRFQRLDPKRRPDYTPIERRRIVFLKHLNGWSINDTARRFVLCPNTVRAWMKEAESKTPIRRLDSVPWNRYHDRVRHVVQLLRSYFPERHIGVRTIARWFVHCGVQISKSFVHEVIQDTKPRKWNRRPALLEPDGVEPFGLLDPKRPNVVWQIDLTYFRFLSRRLCFASIVDGCSRKILALRVYGSDPNRRQIIELIQRTALRHAAIPTHLICDNGGQFIGDFGDTLKRRLGIRVVHGKVRKPCFNGKVERFFRTFKFWLRATILPFGLDRIQCRADDFRDWYNSARPHQALDGLTPDQVYYDEPIAKPIRIFQREFAEVKFDAYRIDFRGDPHLPCAKINFALKSKEAA